MAGFIVFNGSKNVMYCLLAWNDACSFERTPLAGQEGFFTDIGVRARPNLGGRHLFARKSQKNFLKKKSPNVCQKIFARILGPSLPENFCPKIFSYYINFGHFARKFYFWGGCRPPPPWLVRLCSQITLDQDQGYSTSQCMKYEHEG